MKSPSLGETMQCELCGKTTDPVRARIEGVELDVCPACASFGTVLRKAPPIPSMAQQKQRAMRVVVPQPKERLVADFSERIRKQREKRGLTQEEFARKLAERQSLVQKMESGSYVPSLDVARKIERILEVKLVEEESEELVVIPRSTGTSHTLGDFMKKRS